MSTQQDDREQEKLDKKLEDAKQSARQLLGKSRRTTVSASGQTAIETAKSYTAKDMVLWLIAIVALIATTLVNSQLPGIWQPANDVWVRIGIVIALIVFAIGCLAFTNQGKGFKTLLSDAGVELRRVTWPTKSETFQYTWQVLLVIGIVAVIVWVLDNIFNRLVGIFIG